MCSSDLEFAVIVLGVLIALWIDAGWGWIQDRAEEGEIIEDLEADFRFNLEELRTIRARRQEILDYSLVLLQEGVAHVPSDSLSLFDRRLLQVYSFNPRLGALNATMQSGRVSVLRSRELRNALAGWEGYLADEQEEIQWALPVAMQLIERSSQTYDSLRSYDAADTAGIRVALQVLAEDRPFRSLLTAKEAMFRASLFGLDQLITETERVLGLLEATQ